MKYRGGNDPVTRLGRYIRTLDNVTGKPIAKPTHPWVGYLLSFDERRSFSNPNGGTLSPLLSSIATAAQNEQTLPLEET